MSWMYILPATVLKLLCKLTLMSIRVRTPSEPLNSMTFPWLFNDNIWKFHDLLEPNLLHTMGPMHVHQNITGNITFYVGAECNFWLFHDIFKDFMTSPGLEISHSNSMISPGFPWPHNPWSIEAGDLKRCVCKHSQQVQDGTNATVNLRSDYESNKILPCLFNLHILCLPLIGNLTTSSCGFSQIKT